MDGAARWAGNRYLAQGRFKELSCGWRCEVRVGRHRGDRENRSGSEAQDFQNELRVKG